MVPITDHQQFAQIYHLMLQYIGQLFGFPLTEFLKYRLIYVLKGLVLIEQFSLTNVLGKVGKISCNWDFDILFEVIDKWGERFLRVSKIFDLIPDICNRLFDKFNRILIFIFEFGNIRNNQIQMFFQSWNRLLLFSIILITLKFWIF